MNAQSHFLEIIKPIGLLQGKKELAAGINSIAGRAYFSWAIWPFAHIHWSIQVRTAGLGAAAPGRRKRDQRQYSADVMTGDNQVLMNQPIAHAALIATYQRAQADAAHKSALIKAAAKKGPLAIQAAAQTAARAAKRRDSYAKKLGDLGVAVGD